MEYTVRDGRNVKHTLVVRWSDFICTHFYFLDGKRISVDDRHGYTYYDGKPVAKSLIPQIDEIVFGEVIPRGVDVEEER